MGSNYNFFVTEAIPSLLGILVYCDLTYIVITSELGGTGKLLVLFMKSFAALMYNGISLTRGCRWWLTKCGILEVNWVNHVSSWLIFIMYLGWSVKLWSFCKDGMTDFSPSASFLESKFYFLNLSIVSLINLLCCNVGSSCNML